MSKKRIDETVTQARNARQRKAREAEAMVTPTETPREGQEAATKDSATKKASRRRRAARSASDASTEATKSEDGLCVFAFRLSLEERDLLHKAAGPAKASKFARALLVAAARGDEALVQQIVRAAKETAAS